MNLNIKASNLLSFGSSLTGATRLLGQYCHFTATSEWTGNNSKEWRYAQSLFLRYENDDLSVMILKRSREEKEEVSREIYKHG